MLNFKSNITYYLSSTPTDMRKGREGLAGFVREKMQRDPYTYGDAFIFYSKDLKKVKILHYDINGFRCWLNSGSHDAAQNIAFMYSLFESCKMNDIDFGEYVEDILTRMMNGDDDYRSMIPCYYTPVKKQEKKVA